MVTSETPGSAFTARTSWVDLSPPLDACYAALRMTWTVDPSAAAIMTCHYREPAFGWKHADLMNVIAQGTFKPRYIAAYI